MKQYKDRLFMTIYCIATPNDGARTHKAGWVDTHGYNINEHLNFVDRLSDKILSKNSVVVDIENKSCVKSGFTVQMRIDSPSLPSDDEVAKYYMNKYAAQIENASRINVMRSVKTT
jgi:hypothetical protein